MLRLRRPILAQSTNIAAVEVLDITRLSTCSSNKKDERRSQKGSRKKEVFAILLAGFIWSMKDGCKFIELSSRWPRRWLLVQHGVAPSAIIQRILSGSFSGSFSGFFQDVWDNWINH